MKTRHLDLLQSLGWLQTGKFALATPRQALTKLLFALSKTAEQQRPYFFNTSTKESRWAQPDEVSNEQLSSLDGYELLSGGAPPSAASSDKVRASHLLVKWSGSRRPASWKEVGFHLVLL